MASASSPSLTLVHPTEAQFELQCLQNGEVWRGPLDMEGYLRRERYLAKQGIADGSGLKGWVLVDKDEPPNEQQVLVGCETLNKRALLVKDGEVRDVAAFGVASVFCPPAFRGKGYASRMMQDLTEAVRRESPGVSFVLSVLYSDIGKNFYAKEGWAPFPSAHMHLPPQPSTANSGSGSGKAFPLYENDLKALCDADEALVRKRLSHHRTGAAVALIPDHATIVWHHAREHFVANELHGRQPAVKGAVAYVGDRRVWAIWTRIWSNPDRQKRKDNVLHILRLVVEDTEFEDQESAPSDDHIEAIGAVLRVAQSEAEEWYMQEVQLWNPKPWSLVAAQRLDSTVEVIHRDTESIASLKWLGDEETGRDLEWVDCEKYGWC